MNCNVHRKFRRKRMFFFSVDHCRRVKLFPTQTEIEGDDEIDGHILSKFNDVSNYVVDNNSVKPLLWLMYV